MIHVSDKFKESLQYGHNFHEEVEVNFKDGRTILLDQEIMLSGNSFIDGVGSSSFPVGLVICKSLTLSIDNRDERFKNYDFFGAKLKPVIKLLLDDGTTEKIKKGTYTVTEPENYGEIIDITAMDDAYRLDKPYHTSLVFPQSLFALVSDACSTCDIPMKFSSMEHGDFVINSVPSDMTFRTFLGYTAQIESANARIDTDGYLDFIKWDFVATEYHELKNFKNTPIVSTDDIVITGIQMKNGENSYLNGEEGYVLTFENPLVEESVETVTGWIGQNLIGQTFRTMSGDLYANPTIEFGDFAVTYDRKGNRYTTPVTDVNFVLGGFTTVKTQADNPLHGSSSYSSQAQQAVIQAKKLVEKEKTDREQAIENLSKTMSESSGLYQSQEIQEDGSFIFYLHDKPTLEQSKTVIKLTAEAIGLSTDGGKTYLYGFTVTGEMITHILNTEGINADWINTGSLVVKNDAGKELFYADIDTGVVRINSEAVNIKEALDNLSVGARNLIRNSTTMIYVDYYFENQVVTYFTDAEGDVYTTADGYRLTT